MPLRPGSGSLDEQRIIVPQRNAVLHATVERLEAVILQLHGKVDELEADLKKRSGNSQRLLLPTRLRIGNPRRLAEMPGRRRAPERGSSHT